MCVLETVGWFNMCVLETVSMCVLETVRAP
jgi:hypothetical protein